MSIDTVKKHLKRFDKDEEIIELENSTATVLEAASALNVEPDAIAKTLAFSNNNSGCILIVTSGTSKIDNSKFKLKFGFKAKMLSPDETYKFTSHKVGGVCPFGLENVENIYFDLSLKKHMYIYPACGSSNSCIKLTCKDLEKITECKNWIDVSK